MSRLILNRDQLLKKLTGDFRCVRIYEGFINPTETRDYYEKFVEPTNEALLARVEEFCSDYHSAFTFAARNADGGAGGSIVFRADTTPRAEKNEKATAETPNSGMSEEKMYSRVLERVKKEMEVESLKIQLATTQETLKRQNNLGEKVAFIATQIFESIMVKRVAGVKVPKAASMQGGKGFSTIVGAKEQKKEAPQNNVEEAEHEEINEPDKDQMIVAINKLQAAGNMHQVTLLAANDAQISKALAKILKLMTAEEFTNVANGLTKEKFDMMKNFINQ